MWQHFEGDTFVFYEKLIDGRGLAELQANFEDQNLGEAYSRLQHYQHFSKNEAKENLKDIDKSIAAEKTEEAQKLIVKGAISKIDFYINQLSTKKVIIDTYAYFISDLQQLKKDILAKFSYLITESIQISKSPNNNPKIQWLGKTNVLATLIYDLWQGQDKGSKLPSSKPLLKAQKKDLEQLLIDNFIDAKGQPLTISTISDYLNTSKPEKRAKRGARIEIDNN